MQLYKKIKKGFTLLEVVFVIVILGVVASIGSSIIVQVYESYLVQRAVHNASIKTELAINQLANRLSYRIGGSLLARVPGTSGIATSDALPLTDVPTGDDTYSAIEWIGSENDGFTARNALYWSGFCDLNTSTYSTVSTTGSLLTQEQVLLNSISRSTIAPAPAILFANQTYRKIRSGINAGDSHEYSTSCMHDISGTGCMFPVSLTNDTTFTFTGSSDRASGEMIYSEFYKLAASAYAVVPEDSRTIDGQTVYDLYLYADYQPWNGNSYTNGSKSLLAKNVSVFRFKQENNSLRIKLCTIEQLALNNTISICKEKAIIR